GAELRELGENPAGWRAHLMASLARLTDACVVVCGEYRYRRHPTDDESTWHFVETVDAGWRGVAADETARFHPQVVVLDHVADPLLLPLHQRIHGGPVTLAREQFLDDATWYRSFTANEKFKPHRVDDLIFVKAHAPDGAMIVAELYRPWGGRRFGA